MPIICGTKEIFENVKQNIMQHVDYQIKDLVIGAIK
jgi:hypothetical protein